MAINGHTIECRPLNLGEKTRKDLLKQRAALRSEWKISVSIPRRAALASQINAIDLLMGVDREPTIGRHVDG